MLGAAFMVLPSGVLNATSLEKIKQVEKEKQATTAPIAPPTDKNARLDEVMITAKRRPQTQGPYFALKQKYPVLLNGYVDNKGNTLRQTHRNLPYAIRAIDKQSKTGRLLLQTAEDFGVKLKFSKARGACWNDRDSTLTLPIMALQNKQAGRLIHHLSHELAHVWQSTVGLDEKIQKDLSATDGMEAMIMAERHASTVAALISYDCFRTRVPGSPEESTYYGLFNDRDIEPQLLPFQTTLARTNDRRQAVEAAWSAWDTPKRQYLTQSYVKTYTRISSSRAAMDGWMTGKKGMRAVMNIYKSFGKDSLFDIAAFKRPAYHIDSETNDKRPSAWTSFTPKQKQDFSNLLAAIEQANQEQQAQPYSEKMTYYSPKDEKWLTKTTERNIPPGRKGISSQKASSDKTSTGVFPADKMLAER